ncbi:MAG: dipeptide ABC transporter ATP-binding protein [Anaerolineales bacterium]|nr:dipeptide ABC transporter ATP-binding protein [Anaerolineales bacterium]MCB9128581.1 dipeptide ABC transporter ATP-binding protein [Ardenticatenales bacterium]
MSELPSRPAADRAVRPLVAVRELRTYYPIRAGILRRVVAQVKAVDGVSFDIRPGETLGLVGESGCGKTTIGRTILNLQPATDGKVYFDGADIFDSTANEVKKMRRDMQIVFQDPYASLDPRLPVGDSIAEGLQIHAVGSKAERRELVYETLERVGLNPYYARRYPHEFSGGQRQRIGIARALVLKPRFIVADEPVSALDVSIQSQVLNLLRDLQRDMGLTYLFIAHNLSVVEHISDRVGVMYLGKLVELAGRHEFYDNPRHPYSQALMSAIPIPDPTVRRERIILKGDVPSPINPPSGCYFHPRCPIAVEQCAVDEPAFREIVPEHWVACHLA